MPHRIHKCTSTLYYYYYYYYYYWYSALGPVWTETTVQSGDWYGSGTLHPGQILRGQLAIAFPRFLGVPTFHHQVPPRPPRRERSQRWKWELWARMLSGNFAEMTTSTPFRVLLHAANLRHGTDGFTSPPKEGVLKIFFALKNPAEFEPANLGTKGQHATPRPPKPLVYSM